MLEQNLRMIQEQITQLKEEQVTKKRKSISKGPDTTKKTKYNTSRESSSSALQEITFDQKRELSEKINTLSGEKLGAVVQIIHNSMPHLKDVYLCINVTRQVKKRSNWILTRWIMRHWSNCISLFFATHQKKLLYQRNPKIAKLIRYHCWKLNFKNLKRKVFLYL